MFSVDFKATSKPKILTEDIQRTFRKEIEKAVNLASIEVKNGMMEASKSHRATGTLMNSWKQEKAKTQGKETTGKVSTSEVSAMVLDEGARRHRPPAASLALWVRRRQENAEPDEKKALRIAYAIAKNFQRRGMQAKEIFSKKFKSLEGLIEKYIERGMKNIQGELS